ncbi:haloacid dehalogenase-like hydrolase [Clavibacter sepedonicus]|uniref:haloacid dehalogenase-like hydrolase n=1 Tax=Clavibacter TaxID=1573 RepID=UPI0006749CB1|nr:MULTISPECIES: HAD family hydrolase [Clavibacter]MBD5383325.1 HAD family hydrolase [Clavibacter sp.]UUK66375.1 HAD family hydrolase [Clavibacter sepedonicus]
MFDLDGTLMPGTTAAREISVVADVLAEIRSLESQYDAGLLDSLQFSVSALALWGDRFEEACREAAARAPRIGSMTRVLSDLVSMDIVTCLVTMAPLEFATLFASFDYVRASQYGLKIMGPGDKPGAVDAIRLDLGVASEEVVVVGDGASDIPLFIKFRRTIAMNAIPELSGIARHSYEGDDLREAIGLEVEQFAFQSGGGK